MYFRSFFGTSESVFDHQLVPKVLFSFSILIFRSVGREREVFVRGARSSFVSAEINEAQGRHRAAGDEPTKKYRIRVQRKISRHLRKIQKIKIGSTRLDPNPLQKILDQLDLIQIQFKKYWINSTWSKSSTKNIGSTRLDQNPKRKKLDQPKLI